MNYFPWFKKHGQISWQAKYAQTIVCSVLNRLIITNVFLATGFPVPYIGILTDKGSFSSTISPILDYKYHKNIISLNELPKPGSSNCLELSRYYFTVNSWPGFLPYYENNEIIFLYPNAKNLGVKYSITQRSHRKIQKSILPMAYRFEISNTRLGNHIWVMGGSFCGGLKGPFFQTSEIRFLQSPNLPNKYSKKLS